MQVNIRKIRKCAFCKYWYNPDNSAIKPKYPNMGIWEFEYDERRKCLKTNRDKYAYSFCSKYEGKIE